MQGIIKDHSTKPAMPMSRSTHFFAVLLGLLLVATCEGGDTLVQSFRVQLGTLEMKRNPGLSFVFRVGGAEEVFDASPKAILGASGIEFPGLPDSKEVGIRVASKRVFEYGELDKLRFAERFLAEHPQETVEAIVFMGPTGQRFELKLKGQTLVYRVDLKIEGRDVTLWSNAPETLSQPSIKK